MRAQWAKPRLMFADIRREFRDLRDEMFLRRHALPTGILTHYNQVPKYLNHMRTCQLLLTCALIWGAFASAEGQQPVQEIPQAMEALRQSATSKTEFTLDHSMLVFASKLDSGNQDLLRVIAGVSGVSVHRYRFSEPWSYDLEALRAVKDEYGASGWMQLVNKHDRNGVPGVTDLWVHWENEAISNIAILVARATEVDFVEVSGSISPLDLSHLGGHFGIPKIEGGVRVPAEHRQGQ